ncbi:MAG: hypothetical protein J0H08_16865, partial [Rhizobiales bacterium]|nr:hypothetical protein [Hyphomicrobiales bacterium]
FVQNVEAKLAATAPQPAPSAGAQPAGAAGAAPPSPARPAAAPAPANSISVFSLMGAVIASWFRRLFGRGG